MTTIPADSFGEEDSVPGAPADGGVESRRDRLGLQFLWVSSGKIIAALLQAAIMLLLVREVSPAQFGFFSAAYGVITIPQTLLDLGLPTLIVRERARDARDGIVTAALKLNNLFSIALSALLLVTGVFLAVAVDAQYWLLLPFALWAAAERNADAWLGVVLADGDSWINVTNLVLRRVLSLGIFVGLSTWTDTPPMLAIALAFAVAAALSWFFAHVYVSKRLVPSSQHTMSQLVSRSYPYWINSVSSQIQNLDVALTSAFAGPAQAGLYAAAARLTNPLRILPNSLATILLPAASKRTSSTIASLCKLVVGATAVFGLFYGALILAMPWAVPVFLGDDYSGATFALQVTCGGLVFASASSLVSTLLLGLGLKHYVAITAVVTTFACLAGVVVGSITAGAAGAAIGLASAFVLQSVLLSSRLAVFVIRREPNR
ncbi:oligosaccharide flippase family protein [Clavibacter michiganensis]|uniref:Polysaccharide biosynthesis protein n=1 Tax=Clavibacter michiganensis TaxID=28447 RepID=A0A251YTM7_9MICO|nr:oligosaccharide flippase family protein [Clavibacter michiganensis]OUE27601.1 Polysaccharide biosynthesis protein [Clavibacter michiganensis]